MSPKPKKRPTSTSIPEEKKLTEPYYLIRRREIQQEKQLFKYKLAPALHNYTSGPLLEAFYRIPEITNWEHYLNITEPGKWTDAAMFAATRLFYETEGDFTAKRFCKLFLLPKVRKEILKTKTIKMPLYDALKQALFKPVAFFSGIIIPLLKPGNCTVQEAAIFGSVIYKCIDIPLLHTSTALLTIAEMDYAFANSIFMRVLIGKGTCLPYRVVNTVVEHFLKFIKDTRQVPAVWHECLLAFVKIYKIDLSEEEKSNLLKLLTVHNHEQITPVIRKDLETEIPIGEAIEMLWKNQPKHSHPREDE